jgi:hypothetical protein
VEEIALVSSYRSSAFAIGVIAFAYFAMAGFASAEPKGASKTTVAPSTTTPEMTMDTFLDRLMMAESGGNAFANNPRSTALGPYQFIATTWLEIVRASFDDKIAKLKPHEILELRTEPVFARQVAMAYSQSNAAHLVASGARATFANLRLAFLVGPGGAARVLSAKPDTPVATLLGPVVINANPFMSGMTASDLIARAERDIAAEPGSQAGIDADPKAIGAAKKRAAAAPKIAVACNLKRPSCRKWLALAMRRAAWAKQASRD